MSITNKAINILKRYSQGAIYSKGVLPKGSGDAKSVKWSDYPGFTPIESTLVSSIQSYIANDVASQEFTHVKIDSGTGVEHNRLDSPIYDVLNTKQNGEKSNFDFWTKAIKRMLTTGWVYLTPIYSDLNHSSKGLIRLEILEGEPDDLSEVIVLKSPFSVGQQQQDVLNKLFKVMNTSFSADDIKGLLKINGITNTETDTFDKKMEETLSTLYRYADEYKIGVTDLKTEYTELRNDYRHITSEEIDLIKNEVYSVYGINPNILSGKYSLQELKAYKMAVIEPINRQLSTELNRVLLSDYLRVLNSNKDSYERIGIYNDPYSFLTGNELANLIQQMTNAGIARQNELRKLAGFKPVEGGDEFVANLNSVHTTKDEISE